MCVVCVYIYIYIYREREREREITTILCPNYVVDLQHSTGVSWSFLDDRCGPATEDGIHVHPGQIILFSPFQTSTKIFQSHKHEHINIQSIIKTVQFSLVAQSCPTPCDAMDCRLPGLPVHHQLQEFTQTHVHRVSDAIQPSHPLSSPFPPPLKSSNHQSFPVKQLFA